MDETPQTEGVLVELDARRRVTLGKIARHSRYLVREQPDGTLILEPAVVMTELQLKLLQRPDELAMLEDALAHPERAVPYERRRPRQP